MKLQMFSQQLKKVRLPFIIRRVQGHSMLPALAPGDYVVALRYGYRLKTGRIVIFEHDHKEKIKRISHIEDTRLFVEGDNPSASTDSRTFGLIDQSAIIGKIIWPRNIS